jgi:hypothetical protein
MAEESSVHTWATAAGTITFNASSGDTYWLDPKQCSGLEIADARTTIEDKTLTDGAIVHDAYLSGLHIIRAGLMIVRSAVTEAGIVTARQALEDALVNAWVAALRADSTYTFPLTGGGSRSVTARAEIKPVFPEIDGLQKGFTFGLASQASRPA